MATKSFLNHYMSLVRRFYPKLTYSILWAIPTRALWGEVSRGHNVMLHPTPTHYPSVCAFARRIRHIRCCSKPTSRDSGSGGALNLSTAGLQPCWPKQLRHHETRSIQRLPCKHLLQNQIDNLYGYVNILIVFLGSCVAVCSLKNRRLKSDLNVKFCIFSEEPSSS